MLQQNFFRKELNSSVVMCRLVASYIPFLESIKLNILCNLLQARQHHQGNAGQHLLGQIQLLFLKFLIAKFCLILQLAAMRNLTGVSQLWYIESLHKLFPRPLVLLVDGFPHRCC